MSVGFSLHLSERSLSDQCWLGGNPERNSPSPAKNGSLCDVGICKRTEVLACAT